MKPKLAIDPGLSGAFAWTDEFGDVHTEPMPEGMTAQVDFLRSLKCQIPNIIATREDVGFHKKGNSASGSATFAGHCQALDAAMYALGIPTTKPVRPQTWQKTGGWSVTKHLPAGYKAMPEGTKDERNAKARARSAAERAHKNEIREAMQRGYPHLKVTLKTADALAILSWVLAQDLEGMV